MKTITLLLVAAMLAGCAASKRFVDEPIIDRKGVDMTKYAIDKAECQQYAEEVKQGEKVARGGHRGCCCRWCYRRDRQP